MEKHEFFTVAVIATLVVLGSSRLREMKLSQPTLSELAKQSYETQHEKALEKIFAAEFPKRAAITVHYHEAEAGQPGQPGLTHEEEPVVPAPSLLSSLALPPEVLPEPEAAPEQRFHLFDLDLRLPPKVIVMPFSEEYEVAAPIFDTEPGADGESHRPAGSKFMRLYL